MFVCRVGAPQVLAVMELQLGAGRELQMAAVDELRLDRTKELQFSNEPGRHKI